MSKNIIERAVAERLIELKGDCIELKIPCDYCEDVCPISNYCNYDDSAEATFSKVQKWAKKNPPESPWQPIKTAPKDGTEILCWIKADEWGSEAGYRILSWSARGKYWEARNRNLKEPTHWMPIPKLQLPEI
jgi:hypothetical protein